MEPFHGLLGRDDLIPFLEITHLPTCLYCTCCFCFLDPSLLLQDVPKMSDLWMRNSNPYPTARKYKDHLLTDHSQFLVLHLSKPFQLAPAAKFASYLEPRLSCSCSCGRTYQAYLRSRRLPSPFLQQAHRLL